MAGEPARGLAGRFADFAAGRRDVEDFRVGAVLRAFWAPLRAAVLVDVLREAVLGALLRVGFRVVFRAVFRVVLAAVALAGALRFAVLAAAGRLEPAALARAGGRAGEDLRARLAAGVRFFREAAPRGRAAGRVERERVVRGRGVRFFAAINPDPFRPVDPDPLSRG